MKNHIAWMMLVALCIAGLVAAGCGGGGGGDQDATDTTGGDTETDLATDTGPDTEPDAEPDPEPDAEPDVEPDTPMDVPEDWPKDNPADWPVETGSECAEAGGFCTGARWMLCPAGYEPIDPDPNRDCGSEGTAGWCCVVAPYSACSASGLGNCIAGTSCEGCWYAVDLDCEPGRVCCEDICD